VLIMIKTTIAIAGGFCLYAHSPTQPLQKTKVILNVRPMPKLWKINLTLQEPS